MQRLGALLMAIQRQHKAELGFELESISAAFVPSLPNPTLPKSLPISSLHSCPESSTHVPRLSIIPPSMMAAHPAFSHRQPCGGNQLCAHLPLLEIAERAPGGAG